MRWISAFALVLAGLLMNACASRAQSPEAAGEAASPPRGSATGNSVRPLPKPARPTLTSEPVIGVLLTQGAEVRFTLLAAAQLSKPAATFQPGPVVVTVSGGGLVINGTAVGRGPVELAVAGPLAGNSLRFSTVVVSPLPPRKSETLRLGGQIRLAVAGNQVQLIEMVGLENFLAGVITAEMGASYPPAALQAQAIAARSYTLAQWWVRWPNAWQMHWHYSRDMAYRGLDAPLRAVGAAAVNATRGQYLRSGGEPVLALFHAASGGRTEAAQRLLSGAAGTATMQPVDDPASVSGARGLKLDATHVQWKAQLTYAELSKDLQNWSSDDKQRPAIGTVSSIAIAGRHDDSGRVANVRIQHKLNGKNRSDDLPATDFRMAAGPGVVRSTWWTAVTPIAGGVILTGKGFGHGIGLSQVGAWRMAKDGANASAIIAHYYRGAELTTGY